MDRVLFETATLADAAQRAARVAPTKGVPFDRAQGIVIEGDPANTATVVVSSTDLTISIRIVVNCLDVKAEAPFTWRLPANLLANLVSALPTTSGSTVTLASDQKWVYVVAGDTKAKMLPIILDGYPQAYLCGDHEQMSSVPNLAARLAQVLWAVAEGDDGPLGGVHLDGEYLYACDRNATAFVPCRTPVEAPVTAPLGAFSVLMRNATDIRLRASNSRVEVRPDPYTEMTALIHATPYPDIRRLVRTDEPYECAVTTQRLLGAIERMMVLVRGERLPRLHCHFRPGVIELEMEAEDVGKMVDRIEVDGGPEDVSLDFTPTYLRNALEGSGRERVTFHFGDNAFTPLRVTDDNEYTALVMARVAALGDTDVVP